VRIAIFGIKTLPAFAGADRVAERLIEHLPQHSFTIYLARGEAPPLTCTDRMHYVYVPALKGKHTKAFSFFLLSALHFLIKGGRVDVVHVHNADFGLFVPIVKLKRVPVVGTFHGSPYLRDKWGAGARQFLRISEWVFVRSCDVLTSVGPMRIDGREIVEIPNGVDTPEEGQSVSSFDYDSLGLTRDGYLLFACGRIDATKGLHHLLRAYKAMDDDRRLLAIGDFSHDAGYTRELERLAAEDERVVLYKSLLDRSTLYDVLRSASVFVFPSEHEAMSMMLLEAIACRTLVVCSDIRENVAVVGDDYPLLFRTRDEASLREALTRAKGDGASAQERYPAIVARFRWDEIAARYDAIFRRAAA
jgi:glycosyltransferase involved in cell wall biosynthesis